MPQWWPVYKFRGDEEQKKHEDLVERARLSFEEVVEFELDIEWGQEIAQDGRTGYAKDCGGENQQAACNRQRCEWIQVKKYKL